MYNANQCIKYSKLPTKGSYRAVVRVLYSMKKVAGKKILGHQLLCQKNHNV